MEIVTLEKMKDNGSPFEAIAWAQNQRGEYPKRPAQPKFPHGRTSVEAKQYAIDLEEWEKLKQDYDERLAVWKADENSINDVIVAYIKDAAALDTVPEQYREKVYRQAYEDGHSSGYYEVFHKLDTLVEIFH